MLRIGPHVYFPVMAFRYHQARIITDRTQRPETEIAWPDPTPIQLVAWWVRGRWDL